MYLILRIGPHVAAEWNFGYVIIAFAMIFVIGKLVAGKKKEN